MPLHCNMCILYQGKVVSFILIACVIFSCLEKGHESHYGFDFCLVALGAYLFVVFVCNNFFRCLSCFIDNYLYG